MELPFRRGCGVRAGPGPGQDTGRLDRVARGGPAPVSRDRPLQYVDARDAAVWTPDAADVDATYEALTAAGCGPRRPARDRRHRTPAAGPRCRLGPDIEAKASAVEGS
ncbi:hypothetical protein ACIP93_14700 [Streptomyces sp. NPDC088745]|uniref:hypothetical protein n=1 Tax=Streptomyces sp. NPDC088745 TaxID=3365884 RepID=UPI0037F650C1